MGCDIHWFSETKVNDQWKCDQAASFSENCDGEKIPDMDSFPNDDRDYWFFGLIQPGVRTEWDWSFPERVEIPEDLSKEVKNILKKWDIEGHSNGYLTRAEILEKLKELTTMKTEELIHPTHVGKVIQHHFKRLQEVAANLNAEVPDTDQRIVFFFDN